MQFFSDNLTLQYPAYHLVFCLLSKLLLSDYNRYCLLSKLSSTDVLRTILWTKYSGLTSELNYRYTQSTLQEKTTWTSVFRVSWYSTLCLNLNEQVTLNSCNISLLLRSAKSFSFVEGDFELLPSVSFFLLHSLYIQLDAMLSCWQEIPKLSRSQEVRVLYFESHFQISCFFHKLSCYKVIGIACQSSPLCSVNYISHVQVLGGIQS